MESPAYTTEIAASMVISCGTDMHKLQDEYTVQWYTEYGSNVLALTAVMYLTTLQLVIIG